MATRPKTLTAAIVPVIVGTMLATTVGVTIDWYLAWHALMGALCIQIGTNFINDALDFKKGADTGTRIGPLRATQSGLLTMRQVFLAGLAFFGLAILFGIPLIMKGGWIILLILVLSVVCGYLYTGGPKPLAYVGLGDLFVFVFFGLVSTVAVCYIQTGTFLGDALLAGAQIGLLATVLIAINNLRDRVEDAKVGKRTLAVRYGVSFARCEITFLLMAPFILSVFWVEYHGYLIALLPWLTYPLALTLVRNIWINNPSSLYNKYLAQAALLHLGFGALLTFAIYMDV